jgi:flavin reductase (DIM6/NTAB) family NADH-FMN oxidoreductase RutF
MQKKILFLCAMNTNQIDSKVFRQVMGCFATGIAVVTAQNSELGRFGLTVNSLSSVSLAPPLLLFCLDKAAHLHAPFRQADTFTINILARNQDNISRHFADRNHNPAPPAMWDDALSAVPTLRDTLGWLHCRSYAHYNGGDHTIFVGEVIDLHKRSDDAEPLLYFRGRYCAMEAADFPVGK